MNKIKMTSFAAFIAPMLAGCVGNVQHEGQSAAEVSIENTTKGSTDFPQSDCQTVAYIENLNKRVIDKRIAHIRGLNARVFIALDPILSSPNFDDVPYRHPDDMEAIENQFQHLMGQDIDEVVIWRFRRSGLGAAVPLKQGCAVAGYGEPDHLKKLVLMHDAYIAIIRYGVDDPTVRDKLKKLIMVGRYAEYTPHENKVDAIITKVRSLLR